MVTRRAVHKVTGSAVDGNNLRFTSDATTRRKLQDAMRNHRVVIAGRSNLAGQMKGLRAEHCYAVIGYDPTSDQVARVDPAGSEPLDEQGKPLDGKLDGRFSLPLSTFTKSWSRIYYER